MSTQAERVSHNKLMDIERIMLELQDQVRISAKKNHQRKVAEYKAKLQVLEVWKEWLVDTAGMPSEKERVEWKKSHQHFFPQQEELW